MTHVTRVALVTGGANGIGAASVRRLAGDGWAVAILDLDTARALELAEDLDRSAVVPEVLGGDVADEGAWHRARTTVLARHGQLDLVHNNAYVIERVGVEAMSFASFRRQLDVNLGAVMLSAKVCASALRASRGSIVTTSSTHARTGRADHAAYAAAKGGVEALTRQLSVELAPDVRVNAVVPGSIDTQAWDDLDADQRSASASRAPLGRLGTTEEVAAAVAFLASDDAAFITGTSLVVDGGRLAAGR